MPWQRRFWTDFRGTQKEKVDWLSIPQRADGTQAIRIRRYLLASGVSLLYLFVLFIFHLNGALERDALVEGAALIFGLVVAFYIIFRSGLNLRFADPSLTTAQVLSAVLTMIYVIYTAPATRLASVSFFFLALMFGMLRLSTRKLAIIAAVALGAFVLMIGVRTYAGGDERIVREDLIHLLTLVLTMPWFILIGGYVRKLRQELTDASVRLEDIEDQARRDELTGVFNRRVITAAMEAEKQRCDRFGELFSLCIIDIDHFKHVNDNNGHLAGDEVLKAFAHAVQARLRATDVFGRYGGEEFVQILSNTNLEGALVHAQRIRDQARALDFDGAAKGCTITVSVGVVQYRRGESVMQTFARADAALYKAKSSGRDKVVALH